MSAAEAAPLAPDRQWREMGRFRAHFWPIWDIHLFPEMLYTIKEFLQLELQTEPKKMVQKQSPI